MASRTKRKGSRQKRTTYHRPEPSLADVLFGPETFEDDDDYHYGLLVTSLDHRDKRIAAQLKGVATKKDVVFHRLHTLEYEKSIIPFTSDDNPLGEIAATAVALIVEDLPWGPNVLEADGGGGDDNPAYWHIIDAAQEVATLVVFIFIKDCIEMDQYDGILHPRFLHLINGPWPRRAPYVYLLSYNDRLNEAQVKAVKHCFELENDPSQIRVEFKNHVAASREYLSLHQNLAHVAEQSRGESSAPAKKKDEEWSVVNYAKSFFGEEKGKEKEHEETTSRGSSQAETLEDVKRQLFQQNEKQWAIYKAQLNALRAEIAELKKQLKAKDEEVKTLAGAAASSSPAQPATGGEGGNLLH